MLKERLIEDYIQARKEKDVTKRDILQMILNKIQVREIDLKHALTDDEVLQTIQKERKEIT